MESTCSENMRKYAKVTVSAATSEGDGKWRVYSRITGGQVEATKYVEFRNVTTSSLARNVCFLHKTPCFRRTYGTEIIFSSPSIDYNVNRKQALQASEQVSK